MFETFMKYHLSGFLLIGNTFQFLLFYEKNKIIEVLMDHNKALHKKIQKNIYDQLKLDETVKLLESKTENKCDPERFLNKYKIKTSIDYENKIKTIFIDNETKKEFDIDYYRIINKRK